MKKSAWLAMAVVVALASTGAWAMEKGGTGKGGPGGMRGMADLTPEQQARMKAIGEAQQAEMKPLHEQAKAKMAELKALVASNGTDEAITAKLAEMKALRESMQVIQKKYMEQREQVLTPKQRAKMALMMGEKMGKKDGRHQMKDGKGAKCEKGGEEPREGEE